MCFHLSDCFSHVGKWRWARTQRSAGYVWAEGRWGGPWFPRASRSRRTPGTLFIVYYTHSSNVKYHLRLWGRIIEQGEQQPFLKIWIQLCCSKHGWLLPSLSVYLMFWRWCEVFVPQIEIAKKKKRFWTNGPHSKCMPLIEPLLQILKQKYCNNQGLHFSGKPVCLLIHYHSKVCGNWFYWFYFILIRFYWPQDFIDIWTIV